MQEFEAAVREQEDAKNRFSGFTAVEQVALATIFHYANDRVWGEIGKEMNELYAELRTAIRTKGDGGHATIKKQEQTIECFRLEND